MKIYLGTINVRKINNTLKCSLYWNRALKRIVHPTYCIVY